ncbi:arginine--tRNA ligase [Bacillus sp. FJAT-27986]|uniref:arginine--tRNA ligase n=1 Tax=Bacillus sp. FJAT-27986 TaxID=1743146 RepID=UPI00080AD6FB|nr:arginine--tRNA ligase [Bacillus sp. FJAT-27986]OCA84807.1 arginine--tRNA ligase [Bacillus sp. FJAT-27986]
MDIKLDVASHMNEVLKGDLNLETCLSLVETPKNKEHGDLAFPCFTLAKLWKQSPQKIAVTLADQLKDERYEDVKAIGPYVNFFLDKKSISERVMNTILTDQHQYGTLSLGHGENIAIDMSSPNIAKPFSMGHLRSTVIGASIANIIKKCGYTPVKINHIGDWGTQFGKLIVAYKAWGNEAKVKKSPISELLKLYIIFHEKAETELELEQQGRDWFKKLEDGDEEATKLWKWFKEESLKEFEKIYELLGIQFDSFNGEAFYNDKMAEVIEIIENSGLLVEDQGAMVVKLEEEGLTPCLIKKSDGATLYVTRDLSAALYRYRTYDFAKAVYVVGNEQSLHFKQLKAVLKKLGFDWADDISHVPFGMIMKDGKKMSTRKGRVVLLEEVLAESIELARKNIENKNPDLNNKDEVARQVGVGAVIFNDLKNDRMNNIEFSLEDILKFEGETGPYLQYTNARAHSILRKAFTPASASAGLSDEYSFDIVKHLLAFPSVIERSFKKMEPSVIAKYLIDLAQSFNRYYGHIRILENDSELQNRLALIKSITIVLEEGMHLLGMEAPQEM